MITWLSIGPTDVLHARLVLGAWNLANAGLYYPPDLSPVWSQADGIVLHAFSKWWNAPGKMPKAPLGVEKDGITQADLTDDHLKALDKWAADTGTQVTPPVLDVPASKALLVLWAKTDGKQAPGVLDDYGLTAADVGLTWTGRDATELKAFSAWWNGEGNAPTLGATGILSADHSVALKTWAANAAAKVPAGWQAPPATQPPATPPPGGGGPLPPVPAPKPGPAPVPAPGTTKVEPAGTPWWLWVGGAVVLGAGIWTLSKVLSPAGGSPLPPSANPRRGNIYWKDIRSIDRVELRDHTYVVTRPDGNQNIAYWTGQEAREAQRWLDSRVAYPWILSEKESREQGKYAANPKGSRRIGTFGDRNPVDYGGGVVYRNEYGIRAEYTHGLDGGDTSQKMTVYSVTVPDDVLADHTWVNVADVASSSGREVAELREMGRSRNVLDRVSVLEDIAGHYGWHELDNYPLTMTEKELRRRWRSY